MNVTIVVLSVMGIIAVITLVKSLYIGFIVTVIAMVAVGIMCRYRESLKLRPPVARTKYASAANLGTFPPPGRKIGTGRFGEVESEDDDDDEEDPGGQGDLYNRRMNRQRYTRAKYGPRVAGGPRYRRGLQHPIRIRVNPQTRRYYDE
jgi:hypothetical protein